MSQTWELVRKIAIPPFLWIGDLALRAWSNIRTWRPPEAQYWLWPILQVSFISLFSFLPLLVFALDTYIKSQQTITYSKALGDLLYAGQLMFYAIGFLASASWALIHHIQWPRILKPIFLLMIFGATIAFSVTVGVNPTASALNKDAFRQASYWTFGVSIALYLICEILAAVQPLRTIEKQLKNDEEDFTAQFEREMGKR